MRWFRMAPAVYCVIGALAAIVAAFIFFGDRDAEAAKAAALAGQPPAAVEIDAFDPARHAGPAGERTVLAQIDASKMADVVETEDGRETKRWLVAPLYPVKATSAAGPATGALVQEGAITDAQLQSFVVGQGPLGPVVRLNGVEGAEGSALDKAAERGVTMRDNPVLVDPFESGRDAGLAPSGSGREGALIVLMFGLIVIGYGLARWAFIARDNRRYEQAGGR